MSSSEFEISGATDVMEVIEWAKENAGPARTYTIYAVVLRGDDSLGLVRVMGTDPSMKK